MQDSKETRWNVDGEAEAEADSNPRDAGDRPDEADAEAIEAWRRYRKWASSRRRGNIDRSLYTWKGYRTWSEQVKRNWPDS
jgi:hypothetical protein